MLAGCDPGPEENGGQTTQEPTATPEVNADAHAAAQSYAQELADFATAVSEAVAGWDPFEDDASQVEALAARVPTLAAHDDVDHTPLYLAAQQAEHTVAISVSELTVMTDLEFDAAAWLEHLTESVETSQQLQNDVHDDLAALEESGDARHRAAIEVWREFVEARRDLNQADYEYARSLYGQDRLAQSLVAFLDHTAGRQLGIWDAELEYLDTAEHPELGNHAPLLHRNGFGRVLGSRLPSEQGAVVADAFAAQIERAAQALSSAAGPDEVPLAGDAYRALIAEGFETGFENFIDFDPYRDARHWMLWRAGELEDMDPEALAEAEALILMQVSEEGLEGATALNWSSWSSQIYVNIAEQPPLRVDGSPGPWIPSGVAWAQQAVAHYPPPAWIAHEVEAMVTHGQEFVDELDALLAEDPDVSGEPVGVRADQMQADVTEAFESLSRRVEDPNQLRAAIEEALDATR